MEKDITGVNEARSYRTRQGKSQSKKKAHREINPSELDSNERTYFDFYSKIANQQNMIQDFIRTDTYHKAIINNPIDFQGRVMDVGTGSGILAMFAAKAGAKKVFAIEASDSVNFASKLISSNSMGDVISLINKRIEDIATGEIPSQSIDTIVSEPLGLLLVNERMLETYILARDKYLSPGGKLYPSSSVLHFMLFSDEQLFNEQMNKISFWNTQNFYDLDLRGIYNEAKKEKFSQPVIDIYNCEQK